MGPNIVMGAFSMPVDVVGATQVSCPVLQNKLYNILYGVCLVQFYF